MPEDKRSNPERSGEELLLPAFKSNAHAAWFLIVVVVALFLPKIIASTGLISRQNSYEIMPEGHGGYSFIKEEIFDKKEDVDVLFVGGSVLWWGVDTPQAQKALSERLERPANVLTFGHNFNSADIPYTILRDTLERRRVRLVVLSIPRLTLTKGPSSTAYRFLRYEDDDVAGLPIESRISLYACNVLRSPRNLLTMVRKNRSMAKTPYVDTLGADLKLEGMIHNPAAFEKFTPPARDFSISDLFYSDSTKEHFLFTDKRLPTHQGYYLDKTIELLHEKGVPFVILNIPQYGERNSDQVIERLDWPELLGSDVPLIGIPPSVLFAGLDENEVKKLYSDLQHFNLNGSEYFTHAVLPAILDAYEKHATKRF